MTDNLLPDSEFKRIIQESDAFWLNTLDNNTKITSWNKAAEKISGYSASEVLGRSDIWNLLYPDENYRNSILSKAFEIINQGKGLTDFETVITSKDGSAKTLSWNTHNIKDSQNNIIGSMAIARDITMLREDERELEFMTHELEDTNKKLDQQAAHAKHYQESLIEWTKIDFEDLDLALKKGVKISSNAMDVERVSIWSLDNDQKEINCLVMYLRTEKNFTSGAVLSRDDYPNYFNAISKGTILAIKNAQTHEATSEFTEGYLKPLDIHSMLDIPIIKEGKVIGVICYEATKKERPWTITEEDFASATANSIALAFEIANRKKIEKKLDHQAHHDSLTGLPNRVLLNQNLEYAIIEAKRKKHKVALLFIDLDHFKEINDSLGHDIGDMVLKSITSKLHETIREIDMVSRLGGDEFTVILNDLSQAQDASLIAEKLLIALSEIIQMEGHTLNVSSSIGISIYPDDGEDAQSLLKYADSAMYKAKNEGRNNYQYYSSDMTELAFERVVMQTALKEGIKNEEFHVYYQAQVNGLTNKLIGMEALVRWQHPTMGLVSPAKFIPLAESTGLIVELDRYVMKNAMRQISKWYEQGLNPGVLAMNLAVKQLKQDDFIQVMKSLFQETNCKPQWIELEVTESQVMINPEEAIKVLHAIHELGIELAIDDFGTGYSSLAYLKRLPIDKLKIDQEFIRGLPDDEEDAEITKAVIALAKSLNLKVIAEGVETKEQKDFIVENGCENIQGFYYSKPVPFNEFEAILRDGFKG